MQLAATIEQPSLIPLTIPAFTLKTRGDFEAGRLETDEGAYTQRIKLANEIAQVLRKNLVQG